MSEEISSPSVNVPRAIVASILINGALGFGILMAILFCLGDPDAALNSPTGYPYIEVFTQGTGSVAAATGMAVIVTAPAFSSSIGFVATASRMIWSFARDRALPFSKQLASVSLQKFSKAFLQRARKLKAGLNDYANL